MSARLDGPGFLERAQDRRDREPFRRLEDLPEWSAAAGTTAIHRHSPPSETQVTGNGGKMVTHGAK